MKNQNETPRPVLLTIKTGAIGAAQTEAVRLRILDRFLSLPARIDVVQTWSPGDYTSVRVVGAYTTPGQSADGFDLLRYAYHACDDLFPGRVAAVGYENADGDLTAYRGETLRGKASA